MAIVPAGGTGLRMGKSTPKQFLMLQNKPILIHTLQKLAACSLVDNIILGVPESYIGETEKCLSDWPVQKVQRIVQGGRERQHTVYNALKVADADASILFTHDAVRPMVSVRKIEEVIKKARTEGAAILAVREKCTIKRVISGMVSETVDRSDLWEIQTPQAFRADWLREAYALAERENFAATDDAMLVERMDRPVFVVEGEDRNIKITTPEDLRIAEALFASESL